MTIDDTPKNEEIFFGMSREDDERSLAAFLRLFSREEFTDLLIPRMSEQEITRVVDTLSDIMRNRLRENEYHSVFLGQSKKC